MLSADELGLFSRYEKQYRQGKAIALEDLDSTELSQSALAANTKSALMVPIIIGDRLWGVLCCHYCTPTAFLGGGGNRSLFSPSEYIGDRDCKFLTGESSIGMCGKEGIGNG